jgi:hypothetical protein
MLCTLSMSGFQKKKRVKTFNYHRARELQRLIRPYPDAAIPQAWKDVKLPMSEMTVN